VGCSRGYWCSDVFPASAPGCGKHFRSLESFDEHRIGDGCLPSAALVGRGWKLVEGFWLSPKDLEKARSRGAERPGRRGRARGRVMGADGFLEASTAGWTP